MHSYNSILAELVKLWMAIQHASVRRTILTDKSIWYFYFYSFCQHNPNSLIYRQKALWFTGITDCLIYCDIFFNL